MHPCISIGNVLWTLPASFESGCACCYVKETILVQDVPRAHRKIGNSSQPLLQLAGYARDKAFGENTPAWAVELVMLSARVCLPALYTVKYLAGSGFLVLQAVFGWLRVGLPWPALIRQSLCRTHPKPQTWTLLQFPGQDRFQQGRRAGANASVEPWK